MYELDEKISEYIIEAEKEEQEVDSNHERIKIILNESEICAISYTPGPDACKNPLKFLLTFF